MVVILETRKYGRNRVSHVARRIVSLAMNDYNTHTLDDMIIIDAGDYVSSRWTSELGSTWVACGEMRS